MQWLPSTLRCWGECEGMCHKVATESKKNQSREHENKIQLNAGDVSVFLEMKPLKVDYTATMCRDKDERRYGIFASTNG